MSKVRPSATGIVFNDDKTQALVIKRQDVPVWALPGGAIDDGETPEDAVTRELQEETGYSVSITRKVAEYYPTNRLGRVTHFYECTITGGEASPSEECTAIGFYPIDDLPEFFFPLHRDWIQDAKQQNQKILHQPIQGLTYWRVLWNLIRHPMLVIRFLLAKKGFPFFERKTKD